MSTTNATSTGNDSHGDGHHDVSYLHPKGPLWVTLWDWATTIDHKKIGVMYMFATTFMFFLGGVFALAVRAELFMPTQVNEAGEIVGQLFANNIYNRMFTLHGVVMVFLFIIPAIPAAFGNFLLPLMLGAKDVAFPRLNLLSWYVYLLGAGVAIIALLGGGIDTGWTFYTPYSITGTEMHRQVFLMTMGAFILGFSSIFTGLNFVVTVHKLRAPGMGWFDMPLFVWAIYATSLIQVLATPVLGITVLLLAIEQAFHVGIFDPALGGDPVLFMHFFWFYSHPAVYIMILPGMGIMSELIAVHARKRIFGYKAIAFSSLGIAAVSFIVWGHHLFTAQTAMANAIFSALTFFVAIPSAIKVFNWVATLYKSGIVFNTPMLYALGFMFTFTIGGVTGLFLATIATDINLHDTYFVVAHFHYVMMGGAGIALFGGMHHWWPKMFGKMYNEKAGIAGFIFVFIGFNTTFFIQFLMGSQGMPRRYATYVPEFTIYHQISTVGSWLLLIGFLIHLFNFIASLRNGKPAPRNPWGGLTLEWTTDAPPIEHNFHHEPVIHHGPYDFEDVVPPFCDEKDYPLPAPLKPSDKKH